MDIMSSRSRKTGSLIVLLVAVALRRCEMSDIRGFYAGYINAVATSSKVNLVITGLFDNVIIGCNPQHFGSVVLENVNVTCHGVSCPQGVNFTCTATLYVTFAILRAEFSIPSTTGTTFSLESLNPPATRNGIGSNGTMLYAKIGPEEISAAFGEGLLYMISRSCDLEIKIPIDDLEDKAVTCEYDTEYCGHSCPGRPEMDLDANNCTLKMTNAFQSVRYGPHIMVLKLRKNGMENSQMPLHIFLRVQPAISGCDSPKFISPSPEDGDCFQIFSGNVLVIEVAAESAKGIQEIKATNLIGMTQTPLQQVGQIAKRNFTYNTSDIKDTSFPGARIVCLQASDSFFLASETRCIKIFVNDAIKKFIELTPTYPKPAILGNAFSISFTSSISKISQTQKNVSCRFHHVSNGSVAKDFVFSDYQSVTYSEENLTISFPNGSLAEGTYYAVLHGLAFREKYCKLYNWPYGDPTVTFDVVKPLTLTLLANFTTSNSSATILWKVNRFVVSSACQIVSPTNHITTMNCSEEWTGSDLIAGKYSITVVVIDKYGFNTSATFTWTVDNRLPNLTIIKQPASPSNARYVDIKFSCNEACTTRCVLQNESSSMEFEDCGGKLSIDTKTFRTPYLLSLLNYTLKVIPTDAVGNEGESKHCEWTSDMDPPDCTIVKSPAVKSNKTAVEFGFTCSEPSTTKCSLTKQGESSSFIDCGGSSTVSLKSYSTPNLLTATTYVFKVYCIDTAGNNGVIKTHEWQTDFSKPTCAFTEKPPANSSETMVKFTITCNEATKLSCAIKKGNYDATDRTCGSDLSAAATTFQTEMLESGYMYTFIVHSIDGAGNTGDTISHDWHTKIPATLRARLNMQVSEDTNDHDVYNKYANKVKGPLKASRISTIRKGSLIIDYDVDVNNWNHVLSIIEKGSVVVDGAIIPIQSIQLQKKDGEAIDISTHLNPCIIYEKYKTCPTEAPCVADGNKDAKCSMDSIGTSRGVIALSVSIVAFFILLGSVLLMIHLRKPRMKNKEQKNHLDKYSDGQQNNIMMWPLPHPSFLKRREQPEKYNDMQNNFLNWSWYQPRLHTSRIPNTGKFQKPYSENQQY